MTLLRTPSADWPVAEPCGAEPPEAADDPLPDEALVAAAPERLLAPLLDERLLALPDARLLVLPDERLLALRDAPELLLALEPRPRVVLALPVDFASDPLLGELPDDVERREPPRELVADMSSTSR